MNGPSASMSVLQNEDTPDVCPNPLLGSLGIGDHINNHMKKQENVKTFPSCHPSYTPTVEIPSAFVALVSMIVIKCCPPQEEGKHSHSALPEPMFRSALDPGVSTTILAETSSSGASARLPPSFPTTLFLSLSWCCAILSVWYLLQ